MPMYEYKCKNCGKIFVELRKINEETKIECPECKSEDVKQMVGKSLFVLKGNGFHKNEYPS